MKYIIRKISQEDGEVFDFIDIATTGSEFWAKKIVKSLNTTEDEEFGVIPVIEDNDGYGDDGEFYDGMVDKSFASALVDDGLDGDITVTIDGTEYPLFIDYFHTDINKRVRTYYAHYYKGDGSERMFSECVPYTFTNKDMSNINR